MTYDEVKNKQNLGEYINKLMYHPKSGQVFITRHGKDVEIKSPIATINIVIDELPASMYANWDATPFRVSIHDSARMTFTRSALGNVHSLLIKRSEYTNELELIYQTNGKILFSERITGWRDTNEPEKIINEKTNTLNVEYLIDEINKGNLVSIWDSGLFDWFSVFWGLDRGECECELVTLREVNTTFLVVTPEEKKYARFIPLGAALPSSEMSQKVKADFQVNGDYVKLRLADGERIRLYKSVAGIVFGVKAGSEYMEVARYSFDLCPISAIYYTMDFPTTKLYNRKLVKPDTVVNVRPSFIDNNFHLLIGDAIFHTTAYVYSAVEYFQGMYKVQSNFDKLARLQQGEMDMLLKFNGATNCIDWIEFKKSTKLPEGVLSDGIDGKRNL